MGHLCMSFINQSSLLLAAVISQLHPMVHAVSRCNNDYLSTLRCLPSASITRRGARRPIEPYSIYTAP